MTKYGSNTFAYNGEGYRIQKNNIHYRVWQGKILSETTESDTLTYLYGATGEILGMDYNGSRYYYAKNVQGDVVALLDGMGALVGRYIYDPWGKIVKIVDATGVEVSQSTTTHILNINPIRYRSYYYDTETGFYYLQTRYYDPETGRFLNADAFKYLGADGPIHGMNLYSYCGNNPVKGYDPEGTDDWWQWGLKIVATGVVIGLVIVATGGSAAPILASAAIGAVSGGLCEALTDGDVEDIANGMLSGAISGAIGGGFAKKFGTLAGKVAGRIVGSYAGDISNELMATGEFNPNNMVKYTFNAAMDGFFSSITYSVFTEESGLYTAADAAIAGGVSDFPVDWLETFLAKH